MKDLLFVGLGGMIGSLIRFSISKINFINSAFPINIFLINILGCFLAGLFFKYSLSVDRNISITINHFLIIGFCGGFTTFSAYSLDSLNLLSEGKFILQAIYLILSSTIGILFCYLGMNIIK